MMEHRGLLCGDSEVFIQPMRPGKLRAAVGPLGLQEEAWGRTVGALVLTRSACHIYAMVQGIFIFHLYHFLV